MSNTNINILLVDDNQFILQTIFELLDSANYKKVERAKSAEEALLIMSGKKFDIIITDVEMGDINGLELLKMVRTGKAGVDAKTPVVVLTSHSAVHVLGTAIALDACGFLAKPIKIATLINKIEEVTSRKLALRPAIAYEVIPTSILQVEEPAQEEKEEEQQEEAVAVEEKKEETRMVDLEELEDGMVLAADIGAKSGSRLIKSGTKLNANAISRIAELQNIIENIKFEVFN